MILNRVIIFLSVLAAIAFAFVVFVAFRFFSVLAQKFSSLGPLEQGRFQSSSRFNNYQSKVIIADQNYFNILQKPSGMLDFQWNMTVEDTSFHNAKAIWVCMVSASPEGDYVTKSKKIDLFASLVFPHTGSLLPGELSLIARPVDFQIPNDSWTTDSSLFVEITKVSYSKDQNLKKVGNLFAKLRGEVGNNGILIFKHDPSLLKVTRGKGLNTTLIAFATSPPKVIRYVIKHGGGSVQSVCGKGKIGIMDMAAINPNVSALRLALDNGSSVNEGEKIGTRSPLEFAILAHWRQNVDWLIDHHAHLEYRDNEHLTPLDLALEQGEVKVFWDLVHKGANVRAKSEEGQNMITSALNKPWMIRQVVKAGVPVDERTPSNGMTALMYATLYSSPLSQKILLELGANPNLRDNSGQNCYELAKKANTLNTDSFFKKVVESAKRAVASGHLDGLLDSKSNN